MTKTKRLEVTSLASRLEGEIHCDPIRRHLVATDGSIYQKVPEAVIYPKTADDVCKAIAFAKAHGLTLHARGSGSGLCGSALGSGMVIDFTKYMNRLIRLDTEKRWFECEPGFRLGELDQTLTGSGLFFPPDPSSGEYASFGGMYGTNASGAHSVKYGNVADYILDAQVVFADGACRYLSQIAAAPLEDLPANLSSLATLYSENQGRIHSAYPDIQCNVAGYNLRGLVQSGRLTLQKLFAGAEGTLGVVTRLRFRLAEKPAHDSLVVAFFDDIIRSAKAVQQVMPMKPSGIEVMDKSLLNLAREEDPRLRDKIPGDIDNLLLIEFDSADREQAARQAEAARELLLDQGLAAQAHLAASTQEKQRFWAVRKAAVPILYKLKGEKKILALIEDAAVPIHGLVDYFEGIYRILNRHRLDFVVYGHIAKGLMHTRPLMNLKDEEEIARLKVLAQEVYDLVAGIGGTVSGEHGDGRLRTVFVKKRYPDIYGLFLETKRLLDPGGLFNPEIITRHDPDQITSDLRYGSRYRAADGAEKQLLWETNFLNQVEACHGCSKCTTVTPATRMCPVYKATRDEAASPKAKANILRALISEKIADTALFEQSFRQVMDQCINCGSCYSECPSNVNIPKLALEVKARYVAKEGASLHNRLLTRIETAARATHPFSKQTAPLLATAPVKRLAETIAGIASQRDLPCFSGRPLKRRVASRTGNGDTRVLYFAGCYASYIRPEIGEAAVEVLSRLGVSVMVPEQHCCGLPMLSKGMARQAGQKLRRNLERWSHLLSRADHLVVTCSSCGLSLMQEWAYLHAGREIAEIRQKTIHIATLVTPRLQGLPLADSALKLAYHMPCHLKVQRDAAGSMNMLGRLPGVAVCDLKSNCCGMAGSWGMHKDHYRLSKEIGAMMIDRLETSSATAGVTDCPTCRIQMEQFSSKPIYHPIEILAKRLKQV